MYFVVQNLYSELNAVLLPIDLEFGLQGEKMEEEKESDWIIIHQFVLLKLSGKN